jgi:SP family facilitated glucose transporter-like MFS transporter 1
MSKKFPLLSKDETHSKILAIVFYPLKPIPNFAALRFYRQKLNVIADIEEMETEMQEVNEDDPKEQECYARKKLFTTKALHIPLMIACMLQVIQQLSGINAVSISSL